jgi:hypothetical protein
MSQLEVRVSSLVTFESHPQSCWIAPPDEGLGLAVAELAYEAPRLSCLLLLTVCFRAGFARSFQALKFAPVVAVEDAEAGAVAALSARDPHKKYPAMSGRNFRGALAAGDEDPTMFITRYINLPLDLTVAPSVRGPSVFLTATLQRHVSNTLAVDLTAPDGPSVVSYVAGAPTPIPHAPVVSLADPDEDVDE